VRRAASDTGARTLVARRPTRLCARTREGDEHTAAPLVAIATRGAKERPNMDPELKDALRKIAEGTHPDLNLADQGEPRHARQLRRHHRQEGEVRSWVIHPPRSGEHLRWMTFGKDGLPNRITYYEVVQVQWDVRDRYQYLYRPGDEGGGYLTVFVTRVKNGPAETFDRAERAQSTAEATAHSPSQGPGCRCSATPRESVSGRVQAT
jgi:hypothetical protein